MSIFGYLTGTNKRNNLRNLIEEGAIIIDIRDSKSYLRGHVVGARNIPGDLMLSRIDEFKQKAKAIILYGAKKKDADALTKSLKEKGLIVFNGGSIGQMQIIAMR